MPFFCSIFGVIIRFRVAVQGKILAETSTLVQFFQTLVALVFIADDLDGFVQAAPADHSHHCRQQDDNAKTNANFC
ncbi:MAG: hypothetical protein BWY71_01815 [Planctomycetes bacterium ADurb.Bin412]|nr:MAG: hypothetical protein BWY71_01815 [Planctomycetes bacterium ADurb.Bin412]